MWLKCARWVNGRTQAQKVAQMETLEWVQLVFLMFLATAVTVVVLAMWVRPYMLDLRDDRDRWKAEAMNYRHIEAQGDISDVRLIAQDAGLDIFLKGTPTDRGEI